MAIPEDRLSALPVVGEYIGSARLFANDLIDHEDGGVGLQDPSGGLFYQVWTARVLSDGSGVSLGAPNTPEFVFIQGVDITHVSLAFDSNMQPVIAFVESGVSKLYWYDAQSGQDEVTDFPGVDSPRLTLDDKRESQSIARDVIFSYVRSGNLYYRQQRDRYGVERLLMEGVPGVFRKIGMSDRLRLQFQFDVPRVVPI